MKIKMMPAQYGDCFWIYTSDNLAQRTFSNWREKVFRVFRTGRRTE
ncbi:MAG: hypothetical protein HFH32_13575 [Eubacterium sp.]|nr:hypothetical protein [Eubacterium sp.]